MNKRYVFVLILMFLVALESCTYKCDYDEFYNSFDEEFVYKDSNSSNVIYEILLYKEDYYVHTTIINDSIMSDTNIYDYNSEKGNIIMKNYIFRFNHTTGAIFLNGSGALSVQFECDGISFGDVFYLRR
jgi:hypothetical protein